jgi:hypothetical protein
MTRKTLTAQEHVELGQTLKRARALLLDAAGMTRRYGRLSIQLYDAADSLTSPRAWLEQRLIADFGEDALISGVHVRDVYFGNTSAMEEVDG